MLPPSAEPWFGRPGHDCHTVSGVGWNTMIENTLVESDVPYP